MTAWRKTKNNFEIYNVGNEDWITVNDVVEIIIDVMRLGRVKRIYKPLLHGVGWLGDIKQIALNINKLESLGWRLKINSREAIAKTVKNILQEIKPKN